MDGATGMSRGKTNYKKHGYFVGTEDCAPLTALKIFCLRRSSDIMSDFKDLPFDQLIARIYLQGFIDGSDKTFE